MNRELEEYAIAFNLHFKAQNDEMKSKLEVKSTYYRLMKAKDALKNKEKELLEDIGINSYEEKPKNKEV